MFYQGDKVVHPAHGVAIVEQIEQLEISGFFLQVFVLSLQREKLILRIPFNKIKELGVRPLSSMSLLKEAFLILKETPVCSSKKVWIRRSQELQAQIQTGELLKIASILRDLGYKGNLKAQAFGESQIFQQAMTRFIEEWSFIQDISKEKAEAKILETLAL